MKLQEVCRHSVPVNIIKRRYHAGINNFFKMYMKKADYWSIIDNTEQPRQIVAVGYMDALSTIYNESLFNKIQQYVK